MKKLLLLGGLRYLIPVIKEAKKLGYYTITCDYLPGILAHNYSDEYHNISITDRKAVLELARKLQIDGIMSFAVDPGVVTAAYVAEKLGLPGCPLKSVQILQNKGLFRAFLEEHNFTVPKAKTLIRISSQNCSMLYLLIVDNGKEIREKLISEKIFIAKYWPNVLEWTGKSIVESNLEDVQSLLKICQK